VVTFLSTADLHLHAVPITSTRDTRVPHFNSPNLVSNVSNTIEGREVATDFKYYSSHFEFVGARRDVKKQVPYCGPTNIGHHCIKFSCHGDLATGICATLRYNGRKLFVIEATRGSP
jgi:hypothetical protein